MAEQPHQQAICYYDFRKKLEAHAENYVDACLMHNMRRVACWQSFMVEQETSITLCADRICMRRTPAQHVLALKLCAEYQGVTLKIYMRIEHYSISVKDLSNCVSKLKMRSWSVIYLAMSALQLMKSAFEHKQKVQHVLLPEKNLEGFLCDIFNHC